jgi:hypothetical protein
MPHTLAIGGEVGLGVCRQELVSLCHARLERSGPLVPSLLVACLASQGEIRHSQERSLSHAL